MTSLEQRTSSLASSWDWGHEHIPQVSNFVPLLRGCGELVGGTPHGLGKLWGSRCAHPKRHRSPSPPHRWGSSLWTPRLPSYMPNMYAVTGVAARGPLWQTMTDHSAPRCSRHLESYPELQVASSPGNEWRHINSDSLLPGRERHPDLQTRQSNSVQKAEGC